MRASPNDRAFLEQLRGALANLSAEASGAGRGAAEAHAVVVRQLQDVLRQAAADPAAPIRPEDHASLHSDAGRFLLTVCGFEEVPQPGPPSKGRPTNWRMPPGATRGATLALEAVGEHLAELEKATEPEAKAPRSVAGSLGTTAGSLGATLRGLWTERRNLGQSTHTGDVPHGASRNQSKGGSCSSTSGASEAKAGHAAAALPPSAGSGKQPMSEREAVSKLVERWVAAAAAKVFPPALGLSDEDVAIATALEESMLQNFEYRRQRPGTELSLLRMGELGVCFERQPDGSGTCAIHCLNNIAQPRLPPEEAAAVAAVAVAARAAEERGEALDLRGLQRTGPFNLEDLQEAEVESRRQEGQESFLAPSCAMMLRVPCPRMDSFPTDGARTGMFDVEAVKVAAHAKGFEVIDIEPTPTWAASEAAHYVKSARDMEAEGSKERWFLGFIVYERLPGRAMHYYSLLRWPHGWSCAEAEGSEEAWLVLDSLDRGDQSPRNRLMGLEDMVSHYDANGEWFKSWLVRWYPVVDRRAAVAALQCSLAGHVRHVCGDLVQEEVQLGLSTQRAEAALDGDEARWDVSRAKQELLGSAVLVERELQVLRLAVSEQQARRQLESAGWVFERAVRSQAERMLQQCAGAAQAPAAAAGAGSCAAGGQQEVPMGGEDSAWINGTLATHSALGFADWNVRSAAQVLLLTARAEAASPPPGELLARLRAATAALEASDWDVDTALVVLHFLRAERSRKVEDAGSPRQSGEGYAKPAEALTEAECHHLLELSEFDLDRAQKLLAVRRRFPRTPLAVCAEAFRREHGHPSAACALLEEFEGRMKGLVAHILAARAAQEPGLAQDPQEADEVAQFALDAAEWNPAVAFSAAENFAVSVIDVRRELLGLEMYTRARAMEVVEGAMPSSSTGPRSGGAAGGAASEAEVAAALATLDSIDELKKSPPKPPEILQALQEAEMHPMAAAVRLWERRTGLPLPARQAAAQPPQGSGKVQRHRLPPQTAVPPPIGGKGATPAVRAGAGSKGRAGSGGAAEKKASASSKKKRSGNSSSANDCSLM